MSNSRHSRKTLPHVCNDVHNCTSVIFHPCIVCYELRAKTDWVAFEFVMQNCQVYNLHIRSKQTADKLLNCMSRISRCHFCQTFFAAWERSVEVSVNHSFPAFCTHQVHWAGKLPTSIIHQKVNPPMKLQSGGHQVLHLVKKRELNNHTTL